MLPGSICTFLTTLYIFAHLLSVFIHWFQTLLVPHSLTINHLRFSSKVGTIPALPVLAPVAPACGIMGG
jgi:hypothetical protein